MKGMTGFAVALMVITVITSHCVYGKEFSDHREIKVQRLLKRLNKPAHKSIQSEDGDIIDCVPITSQPAFDNPLLKNHTIQMRPSFIPEGDLTYTEKKVKAITQVWHKNGECQKNTIPIRRIKKEDILRAKTIESFGKKTPPSIPKVTASVSESHHEYAFMGVRDGKFYGTKTSIGIWKPCVAPNEFSLAQTWLASGDGTSLNTIEVGWQVYPVLYGDNNPRLFVYWTSDGYRNTGCYNLLCDGFVQTNEQYTVGGSYSTASQYDGDQLHLNLLVWKDRKSGNWWLRINDNDYMGYWPGSLFSSIGDGATRVEWGGEIINSRSGGRHTTTDMGSGHFADEWYKKASYFKNLMLVDGSNYLQEPEGIYSYADNGNCYNVKAGQSGGSSYWGTHFFYGGPGRNVKCP